MAKFKFKVEVSVNEATGTVRAAYLGIRDGFATDTREVITGKAFADYSESGELLGVEFLAPCTASVLDQLTEHEPSNVQQFIKGTMPHQMVC